VGFCQPTLVFRAHCQCLFQTAFLDCMLLPAPRQWEPYDARVRRQAQISRFCRRHCPRTTQSKRRLSHRPHEEIVLTEDEAWKSGEVPREPPHSGYASASVFWSDLRHCHSGVGIHRAKAFDTLPVPCHSGRDRPAAASSSMLSGPEVVGALRPPHITPDLATTTRREIPLGLLHRASERTRGTEADRDVPIH
jgi:hypothetical protein